MPTDPFAHLHVASGYSLRHGASHPAALVARAAEHGMDLLALTDRDGVYGAVRFVKAAQAAGIRPVLGVDLAVERSGVLVGTDPSLRHVRAPRSPARGGASVDQRLPRVTLLARGKRGWAALCRLVSATHLRGERSEPVSTLELVGQYAAGGDLVVLLGPASELGRAVAVRRLDLAAEVLASWRHAVPADRLCAEIVSHRGEGDAIRAARLLGFAGEQGVPAVLTNAVRYVDRTDAPVADVLDAARRLVALDLRHVDRVTAEGFLKSGPQMAYVAGEVVRAAGGDRDSVRRLLATTRAVGEECALDPQADLGLGGTHFPELEATSGGWGGGEADAVLRARCEAGLHRRAMRATPEVRGRLDDELATIRTLGYPTYFLTVADVVDLVRDMGVRIAARGSGAGSLVTYLLGISGVDPIAHGLLMERFLSPLRAALPDIDVDVESARRTEVYEKILERFGGERCTCVSMMDTYRARHAIRDVGAALGLPPGEIDVLAKSFPHIRARDVRAALAELPELRASGLAGPRLDLLFRLVERLDGLPRHVALHPCGVLLSDATLLDRTPVEASWLGFPMSQFDKDDVEDLGLLKLDVLGVRMQSAMAYAVTEIERVGDGGVDGTIDLDALPLDDPATYALVQSTHTLGCFQIESPGQRELVGKFGPETFNDLIIDISLFRPGPVKSDMVTPFLRARQGWSDPEYLHPSLRPALEETRGVVVFHEQVLQVISIVTGCSLAEADEARRALGVLEGQQAVREWLVPLARARGYDEVSIERIWEVLKAFASFGFCKAHAAAFALPTYQSAWLKAHHPAAFLAGVLTHDPGMYPKRLILDDARQLGITVLGLDVNASDACYRVERVPDDEGPLARPRRDRASVPGVPDARGYGIRLSLADVKGISDAEVARIVAGRPYGSLADFWHRAAVSRPVVERLVLAGAFDALHGIGLDTGSGPVPVARRGSITRRDLLLQVGELDEWSRATRPPVRGRRAGGGGEPAWSGRPRGAASESPPHSPPGFPVARGRREAGGLLLETRPAAPGHAEAHRWGGWGAAAAGASPEPMPGVRELAARQSQAAAPVVAEPVQLALDVGDAPDAPHVTGLPELTAGERARAELEVLGLDASRHVVDFYVPMLDALGVTRARDLLRCRSQAEVLVAGVKVATQTPPIRSGRRVIFLTLDDATGPVDATFFEDAQGAFAATLFHSWLLVVRGVVRRTGPRGISVRATGCWELPDLHAAWEHGGRTTVAELMATPQVVTEQAVVAAAESRSTRPVMVRPPVGSSTEVYEPRPAQGSGSAAGGMRPRRVLVHASGFRQSPYADLKPAGEDVKSAPRKLWHSSPGSSGG